MNEDKFHLGIKALIVNSENKILLLKVNPLALKNQVQHYWDIPGGRIEKGSTVEKTLEREVAEETGIQKFEIENEIGMTLSNIRIPLNEQEDVGLILGVYKCKIYEETSLVLSNEHTEYGWFDLEEAKKLLLFKYPPSFIEKIQI